MSELTRQSNSEIKSELLLLRIMIDEYESEANSALSIYKDLYWPAKCFHLCKAIRSYLEKLETE